MSNIYKFGMTNERFKILSNHNITASLTTDEIIAGWHFCNTGWDGMLVHISEEEMEQCRCFSRFADKEGGQR